MPAGSRLPLLLLLALLAPVALAGCVDRGGATAYRVTVTRAEGVEGPVLNWSDVGADRWTDAVEAQLEDARASGEASTEAYDAVFWDAAEDRIVEAWEAHVGEDAGERSAYPVRYRGEDYVVLFGRYV